MRQPLLVPPRVAGGVAALILCAAPIQAQKALHRRAAPIQAQQLSPRQEAADRQESSHRREASNRQHAPDRIVTSIGLELVRVEPGSFTMGEANRVPLELHEDMPYLMEGDWDEHPAHRVEITRAYYIGVTEVTLEQYRLFDPAFEGPAPHSPYVTGISWHEAQAFVDWLSRTEGRPYRLPTEAEWEYAARAGTTSLFWSGDTLPALGTPNPWGLENVHSGPAEWVADWHGEYPHAAQTDPVGPADGIARVVRGGGLDRRSPYYARSANRGSVAPDFPPPGSRDWQHRLAAAADSGLVTGTRKATPEGFTEQHLYQDFIREVLGNQGNQDIGLRVVMAEPPRSEPRPAHVPFFRQAVKRTSGLATRGPSPDRPYFRKRRLLPIPPENTPTEHLEALRTAGFHPALLRHQHSPALEVAPNGDVIAVYYTSVEETTPDVALLATRLRFGADQWGMPSLFLDFADVDDHAPMLWLDGDSLRFFWGANKLDSGFPFQWISSGDNGATWTEVSFPIFETTVGPHSAQPITSAFRDAAGTIHIASDGVGPESALWISRNGGRTWIDTGGRTGGRHTAFALLQDGRILGMGGKSSDIDGFMPKSISSDGGGTWSVSKTPFPSLGSNQRPTLIRLSSGRLFFAGDLQRVDGFQPEGITRRGAYVALSEDEGKTWRIKALPGAEEHEDADKRAALRGATIGYSVARQAPNGVIHLITSMNQQALHFALNEAWVLSEDATTPPGALRDQRDTPRDQDVALRGEPNALRREPGALHGESGTTRVTRVERYEERWSDGSLRAAWSGGTADNGRWLLHGTETWYYADGSKRWEATYEFGRKVGVESYWREDGSREWSRTHRSDGTTVWTHYWPNGKKRTESTWRGMRAEGEALAWDADGRLVHRVVFEDGVPHNR